MSFDFAFKRTLKHEGVYVDNPNDRGGVTYCGISRVNYPNWIGWPLVDDWIKNKTNHHLLLDKLVREFYQKEFWDKLGLDRFDTKVAAELFDAAVNCGHRRAVRFFQQALNMMSRNFRLFPRLSLDGVLGEQTAAAYAKIAIRDYAALVGWMLVIRGCHYLEVMTFDSAQQEFARGWINRIRENMA